MKSILYDLKKRYPRRLSIASIGLTLLVLLFVGVQPTVHAITENNSRIPQGIKNSLYNTYKQNPGGPKPLPADANPCSNNKNNFQYLWSSLDINSRVDQDLKDQVLDLAEGQNSVRLRLNAVGGYCDSIISRTPNGTGVITNTTLEESRYTVNAAPEVSLDGGSYGGSGVSISGLSANDLIRINYKNAIDNNRRWAKQADQYPFHRGFTLTGLNSLAPRSEPYTFKLAVPVKGVNYFPGGYGGSPNNKFVCITPAIPTDGYSDKNNKCDSSYLYAQLKVRITSNFSGVCFINQIKNTRITSGATTPTLAPGETFKANFTVYNGGKSNWDLQQTSNDQVLLSALAGDDEWGSDKISLEGEGNLLGGAALESKKDTGEFSPDITFKVPDGVSAGETRSFSWVVYKKGADGGEISTPCNVNINIKANAPFLRVGGGDVVAGARFTGYKQDAADDLPVSYTSANATSAGIDTNGVDESFGSSSSRYAAFASGFINSLSGGQNAFYSNDFFERNNRKDLTFANKDVTGDKYGQFYGDTPPEGALPLLDVSALYNLAIKGSSANVNAALNSSDSTTVSENLTANTTNISGSKVVMVEGDLIIKNNIQYSAADANLIVLVIGNIYIENAVTILDGTYIAYPVDDDTGIVDTCSDFGSAGDWPTAGGSAPKIDSCPNKLTINGRLVASKVVWKRTRGTIGDASSTINSGGCLYASGGNSCAAEFIDFDPRAYFNSPLQPTEEGSVGNVPTSTLDLPPVY